MKKTQSIKKPIKDKKLKSQTMISELLPQQITDKSTNVPVFDGSSSFLTALELANRLLDRVSEAIKEEENDEPKRK